MTDMKIYHFWPYQREEKGDVWRIFIPSSLSIFGQEKIHFYLVVLFKLSNFTVVFMVGGRGGPTSSLVSDWQKKAEKSLS